MDVQAIGAALGSAGGVLAVVWAWVINQRKKLAETKATVAEADASTARAEASESVFLLVSKQLGDVQDRLSQAEHRIDELRQQVMERDNKIHAMEMYVRDLERILLGNGITPPARQF